MLAAAVILSVDAQAASLQESLDLETLTDALPEETREQMDGLTPETLPGADALEKLCEAASEMMRAELRSVTKTASAMLAVCLIVSMTEALKLGQSQEQCVILAGAAAIGTAGLTDLDSYLRIGTESLHNAADYAKAVLPVLSSAAAAGGAVTGAAARYAATAMFLSLLLDTADRIIVPCICGLAALSVADAAVGNNMLKSAKKLLKRVCELLLSVMCLAFTAWLGLSGVVSDPADALAARAAKTAISTALPVVGGILSDAAGTVAAAAGVMRGCVGVFGILAVAFICVKPFVSLGVRYLVYKLSGVICCCVSDKRLSNLVEDLGGCFGLILALNGAGALMLFISLYSLIRTAV